MIEELRKAHWRRWFDEPIRSCGPLLDTAVFNRSEHTLDLIAVAVGQSPAGVADKLLAQPDVRRYVIIDRLAQTRVSTVFAAVDRLLARAVALKIHHACEPFPLRQALFGERALARLEHPNLARVFEVGEQDGWLYSTMELCDTNLRAWAPGKSWADVLERLIEAGLGLRAVHADGLIHGDVKPANILIKNGTSKLGDLGLASSGGWRQWIRGTAGFAAPEVDDGGIAIASDVFAFACTVWAALYGRPPFGEASRDSGEVKRLLERARAGAVVPVEIEGPVPDLTSALLPALEPKPENRMSLADLLGLLVGHRSLGAWVRRLDFDALADLSWARGIVSPGDTDLESEGELIVEQLARLASVVAVTAAYDEMSIPYVELNESVERPGIELCGDSLEFVHDGEQWLAQIVVARKRVVRPPPEPMVTRPAGVDVGAWAGKIAREFIAQRIGARS